MSSAAYEELLTRVDSPETHWHAGDILRALALCEVGIEKPGDFVTVRYDNGALLAGRRAARVVNFMVKTAKVPARISAIDTTTCDVAIDIESIREARRRDLSTYGALES
jgi:hypothetical protein